MSKKIIVDCFEDIKFYDHLLFDTVILHRVNYMPVYLYKELFHYYQYEQSILITSNKLENNNYVPGVLELNQYVNYMNRLLSNNRYNINIDGYHYPIKDILLNNVSRQYKINKILSRL